MNPRAGNLTGRIQRPPPVASSILKRGRILRSDTKASLRVLLSSCLLAAAGSFASEGDDIARTAELIRLHHESIALLGSMPAAQQTIESRICEQPADPVKYDATRFFRKAAPDA